MKTEYEAWGVKVTSGQGTAILRATRDTERDAHALAREVVDMDPDEGSTVEVKRVTVTVEEVEE
jgi:hypothetical protein